MNYYVLREDVVSCPDLSEELLGIIIVERELPVQHGIKKYTHCPHVTGLAIIGIA